MRPHGLAPGKTEADYRERLEFELGVIERMKYPGYFLIVADFIQWAKAQGIPVGPGRGSGAGSVVAWSLTITDLDPLRFDLLFERFLNPDRVSMPDFDIDFCQNRRDEVIHYVQESYGADRVAQIITFGTLQARAVLRDVGRVLQMPYGQVDRIAKMIPFNPADPVTLEKAIEDEPRLQAMRDEEPVVARLLAIAQKLEGLYRHASTHAAGIVIGDRPLDRLVPLYRDPRSGMKVTQFNMKWVEQAGLVKFDFLGLKTLTVLDIAVRLVRRRGIELDLSRIPLDDAEVLRDARPRRDGRRVPGGKRGHAAGAGRHAARPLRGPDRARGALPARARWRTSRPIARASSGASRSNTSTPRSSRSSRRPTASSPTRSRCSRSPRTSPATRSPRPTCSAAPWARRSRPRWTPSAAASSRARRSAGSIGTPPSTIFDACAKFAEYGFNKSHSAPYAFITYQTAWMKANYPVEFLAASLTLETGNTDKIAEFRREAIRLGIAVEPPSVNRSGVEFDVAEGRILYALAAIKGVGAQAVEHLVEVRGERPFRDLADFGQRINPRIINKRTLESLVAAGALDELSPDRASVHAGVDRILGHAARLQDSAASGQAELFGGCRRAPSRSSCPRSSRGSRRRSSSASTTPSASISPPIRSTSMRAVLQKMRVQTWAEFTESVRRGATAGRLAGTVTARQERRMRTGNRMAAVQLSDPTGSYEGVLFSEGLTEYRDLLEPGRSVVVLVSAEERPEGINVRIQSVEPLDKFMAGLKQIRVFLRDGAPLPSLEKHLGRKGEGAVSFILMLAGGPAGGRGQPARAAMRSRRRSRARSAP